MGPHNRRGNIRKRSCAGAQFTVQFKLNIMTVQQILSAKLKSNFPWKITSINFFNNKPICVTGEIIMDGETLPACWITKTGLCYVGEKDMPLHNLIPTV